MIIDLTKTNNREEVEKYLAELKTQKKVVTVSGYFDPLHHGHIELFKLSRALGNHLVVIINSDKQTTMKKGFVFMPHDEKAKIIVELGCVDDVFISIDEDRSQCKTLEFIKPHIFANGGDRFTYEVPETPICRQHGIQIIDGVGSKIQSSSKLIEQSKQFLEDKNNK